MNLLDILFLAVLAWAAWKGYRKGVIATLSSVVGYVAGFTGLLLFYQPLRSILSRDLRLGEKLTPWVAEKLALPASSFQTKIGDMAMDKAIEMINQQDLPAVFKEIMTGYVRNFEKLPANGGINTLVLIMILIPLVSIGSFNGEPGLLSEQVQDSLLVNSFIAYSEDLFGTFLRGSV